jgi:hypothetical protein
VQYELVEGFELIFLTQGRKGGAKEEIVRRLKAGNKNDIIVLMQRA